MKKAVFYGDSNTYGYDPVNGHSGGRFTEDERWTCILQKQTRREGQDWIIQENSAVGRCIPQLRFEMEELDECLRQQCEGMFLFGILLGINDHLSMPRPNPGRVGEKMSELLDYLLKRFDSMDFRPVPRLLVIAPPPVDFTGDRFYEKFSTTDGSLSGALKSAALKAGADFLDPAPWNLPLYSGDHIHLTREGHRIFAENLGRELSVLYP
ncbi:MAG: hypothetical protein K6E34_09475 [Lachnospiraceae bacterium]|nr:hypothetical protein [Lachnospiraceae bacterium]